MLCLGSIEMEVNCVIWDNFTKELEENDHFIIIFSIIPSLNSLKKLGATI